MSFYHIGSNLLYFFFCCNFTTQRQINEWKTTINPTIMNEAPSLLGFILSTTSAALLHLTGDNWWLPETWRLLHHWLLSDTTLIPWTWVAGMSDSRHLTHHDHRCLHFIDDSEASSFSSVLLMAPGLIERHWAAAAAAAHWMAPMQSAPVERSKLHVRTETDLGPRVRINSVRLIASAERGHYSEPHTLIIMNHSLIKR